MAKIQKKSKQQFHLIPFFLFSTQRLSIREPPNYLPTEATEPTEVSGARYSPTDCTDIHRLGGYGILPYPRSHQTIFPQNPTQPNHLCVSVRICGRLFSARSFCVFCEFRGRTLRSHQTIFPTEFAEHRNNRWGISSHRLHRFSQIRRVWHPCLTHAATKLSSHRIHGTHRNDWRRRKICVHL